MKEQGTCDGVSPERRVEFRVRKNGREDMVIVERSAAEGLPEGWIKELVITVKAEKLRKDPFFIDPKSGYKFFSLKDASRYVRTGVIGKYARKPKETGHDKGGFGNGKILSLTGPEEETSVVEKTVNIYVRNSKRKSVSSSDDRSENRKRSSKSSATSRRALREEARVKERKREHIGRELVLCTENERCVERRVTRSQTKLKKSDDDDELRRKNPSPLNTKSEDCNVRSKLKRVSSRAAEKGSGEKEKARDSTERETVSSCSGNDVTDAPVKRAVERRVTRSQTKSMNDDNGGLDKKKAELSDGLPRRASKRLAGIEPEPVPELETRTRARRGPETGQSGECKELVVVANPAIDSHKAVVTDGKKMGSPRMSTRGRRAVIAKFEETGRGEGASKSVALADVYKQAVVVPTGDFAVVEGSCSGSTEKNAYGFTEPLAIDATLTDLWKDPCIAFAIRTLTGESLDPFAAAAEFLTEPPKKSDAADNRDERKGGVTRHPVTPESSNMSNQRHGDSTESPVTDICKDPCIDFAIKTLTGAVPIGFDELEDQIRTHTGPEERQSGLGRFRKQYNSRHKAVSGGACCPQQVGTSSLGFFPSYSKGYN